MKKMIITSLFIMSAIIVFAGNENISYVKTDNNLYFGSEIKTGLFNTRIISSDGSVIKVPNAKVTSIMHDDCLYERLPLVCKDRSVKGMVMMEYITSRGGLRLYKYSCYNQGCGMNGITSSQTFQEDYYFVFRDGTFYLRIDADNANATLPFFGINVES